MSPDNRAYLGRCWADAALGEHASVAAFAHLVLHMMNLGAPPPLLLSAIRAMKEEVQHAQLCFSIARKFLGHPVGPGPMNLPSFSAARDKPEVILASAITEGCIDETVSTYYARAARDTCVDHEISVVLSKIVAEEDRHAELSWNFVEWMVAKFPDLQEGADDCFARHLAKRAQARPAEAEFFVEGYGILSPQAREKAELLAIEQVILPRSRALLRLDLAVA